MEGGGPGVARSPDPRGCAVRALLARRRQSWRQAAAVTAVFREGWPRIFPRSVSKEVESPARASSTMCGTSRSVVAQLL